MTPINIALIGVLALAAMTLVVVRRRRSGDSPAAAETADDDDAALAAAESAATLAPAREHEPLTLDQADADDEDEDEDIAALEEQPEDDDLGEIVTEPGWYLPGDADMSWETPVHDGPAVAVALEDDPSPAIGDESPVTTAFPADLEMAAALAPAPPPPLLDDGASGFDPTSGWAATEEATPAAEAPAWLGLVGTDSDSDSKDHPPEDAEPPMIEELFELPDLGDPAEIHVDAHGLDDDPPPPPPFSLGAWDEPQEPALPAPAPAAQAMERSVTQHGPISVSIDPGALIAAHTDEIGRSMIQGDDDVKWELTLFVELRRRRADAPEDPQPAE